MSTLKKPQGSDRGARKHADSRAAAGRAEAAALSIAETRLIAIIRHVPTDVLEGVVFALIEAGVRVFEVALNSRDALTQLRLLRKYSICLGAGTVLNEESAIAAIDAGADFLFSPIRASFLLPLCRERGVLGIPGGLTPSEIYDLHKQGAVFVKVFPASTGGARHIAEVLAPLENLKLIPTGGVNLQTAEEFLEAGAAALAVGSGIVDPRLITSGMFSEIANRGRQFVEKTRSFARADH